MLRGPAISFRDRFDFLDAHGNNGRRLERQSDSDTTSLSNKRDFGRGRCRRATPRAIAMEMLGHVHSLMCVRAACKMAPPVTTVHRSHPAEPSGDTKMS